MRARSPTCRKEHFDPATKRAFAQPVAGPASKKGKAADNNNVGLSGPSTIPGRGHPRRLPTRNDLTLNLTLTLTPALTPTQTLKVSLTLVLLLTRRQPAGSQPVHQ
eukprot:scaffold67156_cov47-Phaeocystis_antarctica.AAC.1